MFSARTAERAAGSVPESSSSPGEAALKKFLPSVERHHIPESPDEGASVEFPRALIVEEFPTRDRGSRSAARFAPDEQEVYA